jgi:hypothetical protein
MNVIADTESTYGASRVLKITSGATFKNNQTGNVASFISGSVKSINLGCFGCKRDVYNDVSFTIGTVRYVVSGSFEIGIGRSKFRPGSVYVVDKRFVRAFVNNVQVAEYSSGENLPLMLIQNS